MVSSTLLDIPIQQLRKLCNSYRDGILKHSSTSASIRDTVSNIALKHELELLQLQNEQQWTSPQILYLLEAMLANKEQNLKLDDYIDLVLSGPTHPTIPTRKTFAVYTELVHSARSEIILISYAVHNGKDMFTPVAEKLDNNEDFSTQFFLNIPRKGQDSTINEMLVQRFKNDFFSKQWPGTKAPEMFYFKDSLLLDWQSRASMHSKVIIVDRKKVFITSANLTRAAQTKNIETGVLINDTAYAERLRNYFTGQVEQETFIRF